MNRPEMAAALAKLLATSDLAELMEAVARWKAAAATDAERAAMDEMGARILDVKRALEGAPKRPTEEELEEMLRMMLLVASDPHAVKPPRDGS